MGRRWSPARSGAVPDIIGPHEVMYPFVPECPRTHTFGVNTSSGIVGVTTVSLRDLGMFRRGRGSANDVHTSAQRDAGAVEADRQAGIGGLDVREFQAGGQEVEVDDDI